MKLTNSTDFAPHFLRRMVSWICKEFDLPVRMVKGAEFKKYTNAAYRGLAWRGNIRVNIGPADRFPSKAWNYNGGMVPACVDRIEGLVSITAHELWHLVQFRERVTRRGMERRAVFVQREVLDKFRGERATLLAAWELPPKVRPGKPKLTRKEANAKRAAESLARWERKMKTAKTKVAKLKATVRRYERDGTLAAMAAKASPAE